MQQSGRLNDSIDFLMWSYFNLTLDDGGKLDRILGTCIGRAYSDATQQGAYNTSIPKDDIDLKKASEDAKTAGGKELMKRILMLLEGKAKAFDVWHEETCGAVKGAYEKVRRNGAGLFSHGNAQKWVNMSLKYIYTLYWLYQAFSSECLFCKTYGSAIEKYAGEFHAPADSFIIEALELKGVGVWSKWDEQEYSRYQELLNGTIGPDESQLDWEGRNWIKVAKGRKEKDFRKIKTGYKSEN